MHQIGFDLNLVLTHAENFSTSDQFRVTVTYQELIHHTESSINYRSIVEGGQIAGGTSDRRGRQACFFPAMDPLEELVPDLIQFSTNEPRMAHYKHSQRPGNVQKHVDRNVIRDRTTASDRRYTLIEWYWHSRPSAAIYGISSEKPDATIHGNSTGEPAA